MNTKKNHDWVSQPRPKRTENRYNEKKVNRQTNIQTYRDYVQKKYNNNLYMLNKVSQIQSVYLQT